MFYLVMAIVNPGVTIADIERAFQPIAKWYRIAPDAWIVHTSSKAIDIYNAVKPFAEPVGRVFVSKLDPTDKWGWMDTTLWQWFKELGA